MGKNQWKQKLVLFKINFIRVQLLYSVVLVSAVQQSESAILIHVSPLFWISFPFRSPQSTEQSSLCSAMGARWLSIYTQQCIYVSPDFPIPPTPPSPPWYPYICSLCLCIYFCKNWFFETVEINKMLLKLTEKKRRYKLPISEMKEQISNYRSCRC